MHSLARVAWRLPDYNGPKFEQNSSTSSKRETKWQAEADEAGQKKHKEERSLETRSEDEYVQVFLQRKLLEEQQRRSELEKELQAMKETNRLSVDR